MKKIGVVIGRFQVDALSEAHEALIEVAKSNNDEFIVGIGTSVVKIEITNPLSYEIRKEMIQSDFPNAIIIPIHDVGNLKYWNRILDETLNKYSENAEITIYGGRDSLIDTYDGKFKTERIKEFPISGTEIRENISKNSINTVDFRRGIIFAANQRYPSGYSVVDAICVDGDKILMGKKANRDQICLIGGFFDPEKDNTLEDAVIRELKEETGITGKNPKYLTSRKIDDYRFRKESNKLISAAFVLEYESGEAKADDDIAEVKWYNITELDIEEFYNSIIPQHREIIKEYIKSL